LKLAYERPAAVLSVSMNPIAKSVSALLLGLAVVACATDVSGAAAEARADSGGDAVMRDWTSEERLAVELSFLSYAGFWLSDPSEAEDAVADIVGRIALSQEIVWGPVAHQSGTGILDSATDALLFVCRDRGTGAYNVILRGTNPISIMEWVVQDFQVLERVPWRDIAPGSAPSDAWISEGTAKALAMRAGLRPGPARPGAGLSLVEALTRILELSEGGCRVRFAGHSLGGLLSPVMALYLVDALEAEAREDLLAKLDLEVYGYAGPTAGNSVFAQYLATRLSGVASSAANAKSASGQTKPAALRSSQVARYANDLDIAPLVWDERAMEAMPSLYLPQVKMKGLTKALYNICLDMSRGKGYSHHCGRILIPSRTIAVKGRIYLLEAAYQHSIPYLDILSPEREDAILAEIIDPIVVKMGVKGLTPKDLRALIEERRKEL